MANLSVEMYSNCLHREVSFKMVIPTDCRTDENTPFSRENYPKKKMKTLFLLHGYTGKGDCWIPEDLIKQYNFAVICPNGENSFWLNGISTGHAYQSFVGEELVEFVRNTFGLAKERENTYIMGLSMGGFGSLHTALAYPDVFSKTTAFSSAFVQYEVADMKPGYRNDIANYEYYRECFGNPEKVMESENVPETLVRKILNSEGKLTMPEIYMACGTEDFLLEPNRKMHNFLTGQGVKHTYLEWPGVHDMKFWNECVQKFIPEMMK